MIRRTWMWMFAGLLCVAPSIVQASPIVYTIATGGLDGAYGCTTNTQCNSGTGTSFTYDAPLAGFDPASGSITLDTAANTLVVALSGVSSVFEDTAGAVNGIDEVIFTSVSYTSGTLAVTPAGGGIYNVNGGQTVTVAGTYTQRLGGITIVGATPFNVTAAITFGQCLDLNSQISCGFTFGPGGIFQLGIGTTPVNRRFNHAFNVLAVPEPGTIVLLGVGVAGIGLRRRSR